jgi:hydroxymethylpyrimidine pyrophosphatase-like HAD family hydrolase
VSALENPRERGHLVSAPEEQPARGRPSSAPEDRPTRDLAGWVPRLVALDLDGTAVENDGTVARPDVVAAVAAARAAGAHVLIATGRAVSSTLDVAESLGLEDVRLVCSNGAVVYDAGARRAVHLESFDPAPPARALAERLAGGQFAVEVGLDGFRTTVGFPRDFPAAFLGTAPLAELVDGPTVRLVARWPAETDLAEVRRVGEEALGEDYAWWTGHSAWIDVTRRGVSKASGVARIARSLGIEAGDVLAVGDGWNDIELLRWAGHGIAMGHAPEGLRALADAVTGSIAEGGAAAAVLRFFPGVVPDRPRPTPTTPR